MESPLGVGSADADVSTCLNGKDIAARGTRYTKERAAWRSVVVLNGELRIRRGGTKTHQSREGTGAINHQYRSGARAVDRGRGARAYREEAPYPHCLRCSVPCVGDREIRVVCIACHIQERGAPLVGSQY